MIDVLDWVKKRAGGSTAPKAEPATAAASALLPDLQGSDPVVALNELSGWLEPGSGKSLADLTSKGDILARVHDAGVPHVAALLGRYLATDAAKQASRESAWKALVNFQARVTHRLGRSAKALLDAAYQEATLLAQAEASTVRALHSCRILAKICFVHYVSVPPSVWRLAYALHAGVEEIGSAASPVKADADPQKVTTAEQELLRLLMLQVSAPDMMAPEQIEVADRVLEQIGDGFTLRARGVADNPFCFDANGDAPPRRVPAPPGEADPAARYFGPGTGYDALERIYKQLTAARIEDIKVFGADISPRAQIGTVQHLLAFWRAKSPYTAAARAPASGSLQIVHRYAQVWKELSDTQHSKGELTLADENDGPPQVPETWTLRETGGNELSAERAQADGGGAKCGEVVAVSLDGGREQLVGTIRRVQCEPGSSLQADIAVLSRKPQPLTLREVRKKDEDSVFSDAASRQFAFASVRAVILTDGTDGSAPANLLLPAESWKEGRVYETTQEPVRYLRGLQVTRYGEDYVRVTFEWLSGPG